MPRHSRCGFPSIRPRCFRIYPQHAVFTQKRCFASHLPSWSSKLETLLLQYRDSVPEGNQYDVVFATKLRDKKSSFRERKKTDCSFWVSYNMNDVKEKNRDSYWSDPILQSYFNNTVYSEAVVFPWTETQLLHITKALVELGINKTIRGGGTNNRGLSLPREGGVVIDVSYLSAITHCEPSTGEVTAQTGIRLTNLENFVRPLGWELKYLSANPNGTLGGLLVRQGYTFGSYLHGPIAGLGVVSKLRILTLCEDPCIQEITVETPQSSYPSDYIVVEATLILSPAILWHEVLVSYPDTESGGGMELCQSIFTSTIPVRELAYYPWRHNLSKLVYRDIFPQDENVVKFTVGSIYVNIIKKIICETKGKLLICSPYTKYNDHSDFSWYRIGRGTPPSCSFELHPKRSHLFTYRYQPLKRNALTSLKGTLSDALSYHSFLSSPSFFKYAIPRKDDSVGNTVYKTWGRVILESYFQPHSCQTKYLLPGTLKLRSNSQNRISQYSEESSLSTSTFLDVDTFFSNLKLLKNTHVSMKSLSSYHVEFAFARINIGDNNRGEEMVSELKFVEHNFMNAFHIFTPPQILQDW